MLLNCLPGDGVVGEVEPPQGLQAPQAAARQGGHLVARQVRHHQVFEALVVIKLIFVLKGTPKSTGCYCPSSLVIGGTHGGGKPCPKIHFLRHLAVVIFCTG